MGVGGVRGEVDEGEMRVRRTVDMSFSTVVVGPVRPREDLVGAERPQPLRVGGQGACLRDRRREIWKLTSFERQHALKSQE